MDEQKLIKNPPVTVYADADLIFKGRKTLNAAEQYQRWRKKSGPRNPLINKDFHSID